ncbi:hypothetical protein BC939DRAFT_448928 [Gamsiella multidivaricata]|uniref:uncharacterized protein n=1 Tax=Gamsiella multidivaricata TaxID=101098 RepID=UPI00221FE9FE|nr:uncharacterized protein BC939DRAFT_448928 [Gamsiella multidivaricata]KAI7825174.1 hypothetical protein BC939DRAFT_448928 [Gamsiella multidivaricata]
MGLWSMMGRMDVVFLEMTLMSCLTVCYSSFALCLCLSFFFFAISCCAFFVWLFSFISNRYWM